MTELPKRKSTRLKNYDYASAGAYFITICTHNKEYVLSKIVGEGFHPLPKNILSEIGKDVEKAIHYINNNYAGVVISKYVIMPNHIHLIVELNVSGGRGNPPLQNIIGQLKSYTTKKYGHQLWQRSFHDHIIRDRYDYDKIWEYIDTNILKWELDCFYTKKEQ